MIPFLLFGLTSGEAVEVTITDTRRRRVVINRVERTAITNNTDRSALIIRRRKTII